MRSVISAMTIQELYTSGILEAFSTYTRLRKTPEGTRQEAQVVLLAFLATISRKNVSSATQLTSLLQRTLDEHQASPQVESCLTQFVHQYPPHQAGILLHQYLLALTKSDCSVSTIKNYRSDINQFFTFTEQTEIEKSITKTKVQAFARLEREHGRAHATIKRKLISLTQFVLWLERMGAFQVGSFKWLEDFTKSLPSSETDQVTPGNTTQAEKTRTLHTPHYRSAPKQTWHLPVRDTKDTSAPVLSTAGQAGKGQANQEYRNRLATGLAHLQSALSSQNKRSFVPYLNVALMVLVLIGLSFFGYRQFFTEPDSPLAYPNTLTRPNRTLSFQGRLTDTAQNPITSATDFRFKLYDSGPSTTGGTVLWDSTTCSVVPDQDGIFATGLGDDCGSEIGSDVFSENSNVWLEVEVEGETLDPRQSIKTVAYALNSETLQGYPASASAVENTVLVMNNSGEVVLGNSNPVLKATGDSFAIEAETLTLRTSSGSNGDIILSPDGLGTVIAQSYLEAPGATLSATYAGGTSLVLRGGPSGTANIQEWQNSAGSVLSVVDESGNIGIGTTNPNRKFIVSQDNTASPGVGASVGQFAITGATDPNKTLALGFNTSGNYAWLQSGTLGTGYNNLALNASGGNVGIGTTTPSSFKLQVAGNVGPQSDSSYDLGSASLAWREVFADTFTQNGNTVCDSSGNCGNTNLWANTQNVFHPRDEFAQIADLVIGGNSTASADFRVTGIGNGSTNLAGYTYGRRFIDIDSTNYYVEPGNTTTSGAFAGPVGIGTTNPTAQNADARLSIYDTDYSRLYLRATDPATDVEAIFDARGNGTNTVQLGSISSHPLSFYTGGSRRALFDTSGNLRMNTSMSDLAAASGNIDIEDSDATIVLDALGTPSGRMGIQFWEGSAAMSLSYDGSGSGSANALNIRDELNSLDRFTVQLGGNVGVGSTTPERKLTVNDASDASLYLKRSSTTNNHYSEVLFGISTGELYHGGIRVLRENGAAGEMAFLTQDTAGAAYGTLAERMRITNDGNVGIGEVTPEYKLDIQGTSPVLRIADDTTSNAANAAALWFGENGLGEARGAGFHYDGAANRFYLKTSDNGAALSTPFDGVTRLAVDEATGNVGIGTTNPSTFKLQVAGNVGPSADSTFDLGSSSVAWANIYGDTIYQGGNQVCDTSGNCSTNGLWANSLNVFHPNNAWAGIADLVIGGTSTASADFQVIGSGANAGYTYGRRFIDIDSTSYYVEPGNTTTSGSFASNVGVGTTNTNGAKLNVYGSGTSILKVEGGSTGSPARRSIIELASGDSNRARGILTSAGGTEEWFMGAPYGGTGFTIGYGASQAEYLAQSDFRILTNGNVGIGSTNPGATLDLVAGSSSATVIRGTDVTTDATNKQLRMVGRHYTNAEEDVALFYLNSVLASNIMNYGGGSALYNTITEHRWFTAANNTTTGGTQSMTLNQDGNLGIGVTNPSERLHIVGSNTDIPVRIEATGAGGTPGIEFEDPTATNYGGRLYFDDNNNGMALVGLQNGTEHLGVFVERDNGNVGIGTTSADSQLHLYNNGSSDLEFAIDNGTATALFEIPTNNVARMGTETNHSFELISNNTSRMKFMAGGNIGISTTSASNFGVQIGSHVGPSVDSTYDLGSGSIAWRNIYGDTLYQGGNQVCDTSGNCTGNGLWANSLNVFHPKNEWASVVDLAVGGTSTASADILLQSDGDAYFGGSVGIGTTNPRNKLDVYGAMAAPSTSGTSSNGIARFTSVSTAVGLDIGVYNSPAYAWIQPRAYTNYATNYNLALNPNGGNVGIGTTNPSTTLEARGTITAGTNSPLGESLLVGKYSNGTFNQFGSLYSSGATFMGYSVKPDPSTVNGYLSSTGIARGRSAFEANNGYLRFLTAPSTSSTDGGSITFTEAMRITENGSVGIGITNPNTKLYVAGDATFRNSADSSNSVTIDSGSTAAENSLLVFADRGTNYFSWQKPSGNTFQLWDHQNSTSRLFIQAGANSSNQYRALGTGDHSFLSGSTEIVTFTDGGNVGIGVTNPASPLHISKSTPTLTFTTTRASGGVAFNIIDMNISNGNGAADWGNIGAYGSADTNTLNNIWIGDAYNDTWQTWNSSEVIINEQSQDIDFRVESDTNSHSLFVRGSDGNVSIGTTNPIANLDVAGPTIKLGPLQKEYRYRTAGSTDTNWKKIADINLPTGLYKGTTLEVQVVDSNSNYGATSDVAPMKFYVTATRSAGTQDDQNNGSVSGPVADFVRLVKTATGVYELQVRQDTSWRLIDFIVREISVGGSSIAYADSPADGSTTGTIYTASSIHTDYFTNGYFNGNVTLNSGSDLYIGSIGLNDVGTSRTTSGASLVGTFDEFAYSNGLNVQDVLDDLDSQIASIVSGSAGAWTDAGTYLHPTNGEVLGNSASAGSNKIAGLYLADSSPLVFGTDNDVTFSFSGSVLGVTTGNNDINFDSNTLYIDSSTNNVGIGDSTPDAKLDIENGSVNPYLVTLDETATPPTGISYQTGDGAGDTHSWTYPYGSKLSVWGSTCRNFELASTDYPNGSLVMRQYSCGTSSWSGWRTILDSEHNVASSGNLQITGSGPHYISNGNLGIQNTSPEEDLHIGSASGGTYMIKLADNYASGIRTIHQSGTGQRLELGNYHSSETFVPALSIQSIGSSGSTVGIGTTTPEAIDGSASTRLHVDAGTGSTGNVEVARFEGGSDADNTYGVLRVTHGNDRGFFVKGGRAVGNTDIAIMGTTNNAGAMTDILTLYGGNVGIGTTNPTNLLDLNTTSTNSGMSLDGKIAVTSFSGDSWLRLNSNNDFSSGVYTPGNIRADGEIRVGSSDYGAYKIQSNGNAYINDYLVAMGGLNVGGTSDPGTGAMTVNNVPLDFSYSYDNPIYFAPQAYFEAESPSSPTSTWGWNIDGFTEVTDTTVPFSKVALSTSYDTLYSDLIPVQPGETLYGEIWAMRETAASGTAGTIYFGVERYDKDKLPIATNNGTQYFAAVNSTPPSNSTWTKYSGTTTLPTSHTAYNGSDGGPVRYIRVRVLVNYNAGTIPTHWGGVLVRREQLYRDAGDIATGGNLKIASGSDLSIGSIGLNDTGSSNTTSGASLIGTYDEFAYSNSSTVQDVLDDLDAQIASIVGGGSGVWTDTGNHLYPTGNEYIGNEATGTSSQKITGLYLADSADLAFGNSNDVAFNFSGSVLGVTTGNSDINFDSNTLVIDGSSNNVGIGTNNPSASLDIASGEVPIEFDNGGARITIHDGFGNFNIKTGVDQDNVIDDGTTGGTHFRMDSNGYAHLWVDESTTVGGSFSADAGLTINGGVVDIDYGDFAVNGTTVITSSRVGQNFTQMNVDNLRLDGNTLSATDNGGVNIYDNASNGLTVEDGGFVGIGLVNPAYNLHIQNTADAAIYLDADSASGTEDNNAFLKLSQDQNGVQAILGTVGNNGYDPENIAYTGTIGNSTLLGTLDGNGRLQFGTNDAVRMTIDTGGNVGIGTNTPNNLLDINGDISVVSGATEVMRFNNTNNIASEADIYIRSNGILAAESTLYHFAGSGNAIVFGTGGQSTSTATEHMRLTSSGNLGIGVTNPSAKLDVQGGNAWFHADTSGANAVDLALGDTSDGNLPLYYFETDDVSGDILRIRSYRWGGNTYFTRSSNNGAQSIARIGGDDSGQFIDLYDSTTETVNIRLASDGDSYISGGNLGIGDSTPNYNLDVVGTARIQANGRLTLANVPVLEGDGQGGTRVYRNLANFESNSNTETGAIVIDTGVTPGNQMSIVTLKGYMYGTGAGHNVDIDINSYFNSNGTSWSNRSFVNKGDYEFSQVRIGTNGSGNVVIVLGDVADVHSYPKLWVEKWLSSHSSGGDDEADNWSVSTVSSLTGYSLVSVSETTYQLADSRYVNVTGDTMTGTLNLASNGLNVGSGQLRVSGGDVYTNGGISTYSNSVTNGTVEATRFCTGDGESNCVTDFSTLTNHWGASGSSYIYPTTSSVIGNTTSGTSSNKVGGIYLADSSPLTFGNDNDVSYSFSGSVLDVTTGSNDINFDSNTLVIDGSANRVGIGVTNPTQKLTIQGTSLAGTGTQTNISAFVNNGLRINGTSTSSQDAITYQSGSNGGAAAIAFGRGGSYDTFMNFYTNSSGGSSGGINNLAMSINSNGNVGLGGVTSASGALEVNGVINFTSTSGNLISHTAQASYDKIRVWNSSSYTIGMNSSQSYGYLSDYAMTFTMNNQSNRGFLWRDASDASSDGAMSLTTDGRLTVKSTSNFQGSLGVGNVTSPETTLDVAGTITAGTSVTNGQSLLVGQYSNGVLNTLGAMRGSGASMLGYAVKPNGSVSDGYVSSTGITIGRSAIEAGNGLVRFLTWGSQTSTDGGAVSLSERMRITSTGNVGIGTTDAKSRFHLGNNVGSGAFNGYDDYQILLYDSGSSSASYGMGVESNTLAFNAGAEYDFYSNGSSLLSLSRLSHSILTVPTGYFDIRPVDANYGIILRQSNGDTGDWANIRVDETNITFGKNTASTQMSINDNGNVGIGTTSGREALDVNNGKAIIGQFSIGSAQLSVAANNLGSGEYAARFQHAGDSATNYGIQISAGANSGSGITKLVDFATGNLNNIGKIESNNGTVSYYAFTGAHVANIAPDTTTSDYSVDMLLCNTKTSQNQTYQARYEVRPCDQDYQISVSGTYLSQDNDVPSDHGMAAVGDGYALVSDKNGAIKKGDFIVASNLEGYGMKATKAGHILGVAVEDWTPSASDTTKTLPNGQAVKTKRLAVYYYPGVYYPGPNTTFSTEGELVINGSNGNYTATPVGGSALSNVFSAAKIVTGKLRAGLVQTKELVVENSAQIASLSVNQMSVAGHSLDTYVKNIVWRELNTAGSAQIASNSAQFVATGSAQLDNLLVETATVSGRLAAVDFSAQKTQLGSLLAENATISGTLVAENLEVAGSTRLSMLEAQQAQLDIVRANTAELLDATVSGTLYANNISGLEDQIAQTLQKPNFLDVLLRNDEPEPVNDNPIDIYTVVESAGYEINPDLMASAGATLAFTDGDVMLNGQAAYVQKYLQVNGLAYVADSLGVGNSLFVGNSTQISDGVIAYTPTAENDTLRIQPSGQGKLEFLAGLMTLEDGQVTVTGNFYVAGTTQTDTLLTNLVQPADFGNPFQVQVAGVSSSSGQLEKSRFEIINELGTPVATISAEGKAAFAGGIGVGSESIDSPDVASGSAATVTASKTSGKAVLKAGSPELIIENEQITAESLIYVTPVGSTQNQVLYVKSQTAEDAGTSEKEGKFTVGFDQAINSDVSFNWWIVN